MNRRDFLKTSSACIVLSTLLPSDSYAGRAGGKVRKSRPNILWISCEDTSPDLGCYGDDYADTPNLDRLATQGCRYTNAFVPYPVCSPTRSSVITGMYPSTIGSMHMRTGMIRIRDGSAGLREVFHRVFASERLLLHESHKDGLSVQSPFHCLG